MKIMQLAGRVLRLTLWLLGILVVMASLAPYLPVYRFPLFSLISLVVPVLVLGYLAGVVIYFLSYKRLKLLLLIPIVTTLLSHGSIWRYHPSGGQLPSGDIRIMSFNTRAFNKYEPAGESASATEILSFIENEDPDIACFQEFAYEASKELSQYPHRYVDYPIGEAPRVVIGIFSKFPIVNQGTLIFENSVNNAIFADIEIGQDTVRVYSIHLESLRLKPDTEGILKEASDNKFQRIGHVFRQQEAQVKRIREHAGQVSYPKLFCGDMNNSPYSNVYRQLKGEMTDTFREAGSGFGSTYSLSFLPMRIDYIFTDPVFQVTGHKTYQVGLTDHQPVMASFTFGEKD